MTVMPNPVASAKAGTSPYVDRSAYTLRLINNTSRNLNWTIDWGDGSSLEAAGTPHTYADDGTYMITVDVTDEDGTYKGAGRRDVVVNNVAPTATLSHNGPITYGQTVTVSFSDQFDQSSVDIAAGFRYAYATSPELLDVTSTATIPAAMCEGGLDIRTDSFVERVLYRAASAHSGRVPTNWLSFTVG